MRNKQTLLILGGFALLSTSHFGWKLVARDAYESAEYSVVRTDGNFGVREYPELLLVTKPMQSDQRGNDGSFMRLFQYISGKNSEQQKVAMTIPVLIERDFDSERAQRGFVIPKQVVQQGIPIPTGEPVTVTKREAGRFVAIRFAGVTN